MRFLDAIDSTGGADDGRAERRNGSPDFHRRAGGAQSSQRGHRINLGEIQLSVSRPIQPGANAEGPAEMAQEVLANDPELSQNVEAVFGSSVALRRAQSVAPALPNARVLWVDDVLKNNEWERLTLRHLGADVTSVARTETAIECLEAEPFDLIISDISRQGLDREGIAALSRLGVAAL